MLMEKAKNPLFYHLKQFVDCCVEVVRRLMKCEFNLTAGGGRRQLQIVYIYGDYYRLMVFVFFFVLFSF